MDVAGLMTAVADLARTATDDFAVTEMLASLCTVTSSVLNIDGAGVMLCEADRNVFVHSVGRGVAPLELLQEALQSGPCADSLTQGAMVVARDLPTDKRWVEFQALATEVGLSSVVAVPLLSRGRGWGVLDLYRTQPGNWTADDLQAAQVMADVAASYVVMAHDRDDARQAQRALAHRTLHDDLTGLANRALLFDRLDHALSTATRRAAGIAVLFLDLDLFKNVNDTFGHPAGDTVLAEIADRLRRTLRSSDTIARFAGDEFVVICEGLPPTQPDVLIDRISSLTERLQRALQAPIAIKGNEVVVSASIGVAITTDAMTGEELLADADTAMYLAKQRGRGQTTTRNHVTANSMEYARHLERSLAGALDRGELQLHYQPIVHADSRQLAAVEALLRWNRPDEGTLPAAAFIDILEKSGLIVSVGRWVITQACTQLAAWQRQTPDAAPGTVYVNLSARELADDHLTETITAALHNTGLKPTTWV